MARVTLPVDLHETTDTGESEFRPPLSARDGKAYAPGTIPDGFYLVGDTENPQPAFQAAVIEAVARGALDFVLTRSSEHHSRSGRTMQPTVPGRCARARVVRVGGPPTPSQLTARGPGLSRRLIGRVRAHDRTCWLK